MVLGDFLLMKSQSVTILMNVNKQYIYEALVLFSVFCKVKAIFGFRHKTDLRIYHHKITQRDLEVRNKQTANNRDAYLTMCTLYLPLGVFSSSVKLSNFALASKARIVLHYSHPCTHYFKKISTRIPRLPFALNAILNLSICFITDIQVKSGTP